VRIDPVEAGTFDCDKDASGKPKPALQLTIDAAAEYHG
jgi:hypothetical protein